MKVQRFEYKYQISRQDYFSLRRFLALNCRLDSFSLGAPNNLYLVRSLYFDTPQLKAYYEKMDGVAQRRKFRLRTYWTTRDASKFVSLEWKMKYGERTFKEVERLSLGALDDFMRGSTSALGERVQDFAHFVRSEQLVPAIRVEYLREVWEPLLSSDLRISLDHQIRTLRTNDIYDPRPGMLNFPGVCVLEIKTALELPQWLNEVVKALSLNKESNSKYVNAIHHSLYHYVGE